MSLMVFVSLSWAVPAAVPSELGEVATLIEQGKHEAAASVADRYLQRHPKDVEMRFLRGVIAAELKQNAQAIRIFTALTREYPNLPEPYNNLAVIYAAEGKTQQAAKVLEEAIRTSPSYTTAYENLGDLYARMASEAYSSALKLDGSRQSVAPKLALITQIVPDGKRSDSSAQTSAVERKPQIYAPVAAQPAASAADKLAQTKPEGNRTLVAAAPVPAPVPQVVKPSTLQDSARRVLVPQPAAVAASAPSSKVAESRPVASVASAQPNKTVEPKAVPAPVPAPIKPAKQYAAAPGPAKPVEAKPVEAKTTQAVPAEPSPKPKVEASTADIEAAVRAWARAWSARDMSGYFAAYSGAFKPEDGASLADWRRMRQQRIVGKRKISVTLHDLTIEVKDKQAVARFRQHYVAGKTAMNTRKTLQLRQEDRQWRIVREIAGR